MAQAELAPPFGLTGARRVIAIAGAAVALTGFFVVIGFPYALVMPRIGGVELGKRMRETRPTLRVLYTSGYTGRALEGSGILENPDTFIEKPFSADALARQVRHVLEMPIPRP